MKLTELTVVAVLVFSISSAASSQVPPDSLLLKIGFFKYFVDDPRVITESDRKYIDSSGFPIATHFYLKLDTLERLYAVTARHVLLYDTVKVRGLRMVRDTKEGQRGMVLYVGVPRSNLVFYHPDSLVDMALIDQSMGLRFPQHTGEYHWFSPREILTKDELYALKVGQEVFYIGLYPDSAFSEKLWYWRPHGTLKAILKRPIIVKDTTIGFSFKADVLLTITGKGGVSGSPVIMKHGDGWKLVGIINGGDADVTLCTPAYRILEILEHIK